LNFDADILERAERLIDRARSSGHRITTVESCTGGLIAGALTEISGSSDVFGTGLVTYSNAAKIALAGVLPQCLEQFGAVSRPVVLQMAAGGLLHADANIAIAVSGVAGPTGGTPEKPVGLVHLAIVTRHGPPRHERIVLNGSRSEIRLETVRQALAMALH
jgi:nicotinamide-nucleotide amidase